MTDMLRNGQQWLAGQRETHLSSPAVYQRGSDVFDVLVTPAQVEAESLDGDGAVVLSNAFDFIMSANELPSSLGHPQRKDVIRHAGRRFEVTQIAGDDCWRWSDAYRTAYRIHTKEAGVDPT